MELRVENGRPSLFFNEVTAKLFDRENEARRTLAQIIIAAFGLIALVVAWLRVRAMDRTADAALQQARIAEQGHITERFTRAIDQLGARNQDDSPNLEVRLGSIYALERIAKDSPPDHWPIMEILTAYVRKNAPWRESNVQDPEEKPKLRTDIQAVLTVIGRRERSTERTGVDRLDLSNTDLRGANLNNAHLEGAVLNHTHLESAMLTDAHLERANLRSSHAEGAMMHKANLEGADLQHAHLERANLGQAHLVRATLFRAHLEGANLADANLQGAILAEAHLEYAQLVGAYLDQSDVSTAYIGGADLRDVKGLTRLQLNLTLGDQTTKLTRGRQPPDNWRTESD